MKSGEIEIVSAVESFEGADVILDDGIHLQPDVVIAATGFRTNLPQLVGHLGILDERGYPLVERGEDNPSAPGIFFSGYWASVMGQLSHMARDARRISRNIARRLRRRKR